MTPEQLLKQIKINRDLIISHNQHAYEHLQMLKGDYPHLASEEITLSIELNNTLAEIHYHSNYKAAIQNSHKVVTRYADTRHSSLIALHYRTLGFCYSNTGEFELAERNLLKALDCLDASLPEYVINRSDILHTLAMNHEMMEEGSQRSIDYLLNAMEGLDGEAHAIKRANCLMGIGNVYNNMNNVAKALGYYLQAAETFEQKFVLANMASAYSNIGNCYIKMNEPDKAERYLEKSLELRLKFASPDDISISYYNLAIVYKVRNQLDKSREYLLKARQILEQIGNKPYITEVNERLAELDRLASGSVNFK